MPTSAMTPEETKNYVIDNDFNAWPFRVRRSQIVLGALFLEVIRQMYSSVENLPEGVMRYDPTGECAESLYIESSNVWDPENTDRRPAIIVDIGDLNYTNLKGIGGRRGFDLESGEALYSREVVGSVVFAHLSSVRGEALNYSATTSDLLDAFADVIRNDFCFDKFDLQAILRPRLRKESPKDFESLVQFTFKFTESFATKHESQKLKQVSLRVVAGLTQQFNMVS